ncbi:hypothetical protein [uncultured Christiangramia sp.]|uniref:hypothetical protein n=1 Tax=uncultured Christiangramia sp. TaxID=503836 RepID=UPI002630A7B5|nr:hypothetical protein [uncultured Christiangramia sp.]
MLKKFCLLILFCTNMSLHVQRDTREIFNAAGIESIDILTNEVFKITITATNTDRIRLITHSEGEYFNQIRIQTKVDDGNLSIETSYPQELTGGFDKLSAHKVFSLELELEIPKDLEISVDSNIASLITFGSFSQLTANLKDGYCNLREFAGNATINTYEGNIRVETASGLVEAVSRNGKVEIPEHFSGRNPIKLKSIDGNILVLKTK